jgi:hypothetical protein
MLALRSRHESSTKTWCEADYPAKPADGLIGFQTSSINTLEDDGVGHKLNDFRVSLIEA